MKGHVVKRSEDSYSVVVDIGRDPKTGKRKQKWYTVRGNKKAAEAFLAKKITEIEEGRFVNAPKQTVEQFLQRWMRDYLEPDRKLSTVESYRQEIEDHIIPGLGQVELGKLQPRQVQQFYVDLLDHGRKDRSGGLSPTSVLYIHRILYSAFRMALKWGDVSRNVLDLVEPPRKDRKEFRVMSAREAVQFLKVATANRLYPFFLLALETGMREGEILALRWSDIDLAQSLVTVRKTFNWRTDPPTLQDVKTDGSRRLVPISPAPSRRRGPFVTCLIARGRSSRESMPTSGTSTPSSQSSALPSGRGTSCARSRFSWQRLTYRTRSGFTTFAIPQPAWPWRQESRSR